jgi:hypothetical protein
MRIYLNWTVKLEEVFNNVDSRSHRVDIVLSFSPVVRIGTPPPPHVQASVYPPVGSEGAHSLSGEGGGGPSSNERIGTAIL